MHIWSKLLVACAPLGLTLGTWWLAELANKLLGCAALGKRPEPCVWRGIDLQPFIGGAAWFATLLWIPALLVTGLLIARVARSSLPRPWGMR